VKHFNLILIFVLLFSACRSARPKVETHKTVTDTTTTKVRVETKYDTIRIPGDTVTIRVPFEKLTEQPIVFASKTGHIKAAVSKTNDLVEVQCYVDELIKIIESQNTTIETLTKRLETQETTITETEYKTPWYMKALALIGGIVLLIFGIKYFKPF